MQFRSLIASGLFAFSCSVLLAQSALDKPTDGTQDLFPEDAKFDPENTPVKEVAPGVYDLRGIRLIKADRSVSFPAVVNMVDGPQEYFLVTAFGASHESVLRTSVQPTDLHVAMLLLGAKGTQTAGVDAAGAGEPARDPYQGRIDGDEIEIFVSWQSKDVSLSVEAGIATITTESGAPKPLVDARWRYNGSEILNGRYMGQVTGNIISLISDPYSMINHVGPGAGNDDIWQANAGVLPDKDSSVIVTIRLKEVKVGEKKD